MRQINKYIYLTIQHTHDGRLHKESRIHPFCCVMICLDDEYESHFVYAGLCKSKWVKSGRFPAGDYEYIDINISGNRYIVEVLIAREFEIARPTDRYTSLLDVFPPIFVGKVEDLKQVVRLMCRAIKESMKSSDMHVPPWRRKGYMQSKWFGSYKRTTNEVPTRKARSDNHAFAGKRSVGFEALPTISYHCRDDFASKVGLRVGHLTAALEGSGITGMGMHSLNVE